MEKFRVGRRGSYFATSQPRPTTYLDLTNQVVLICWLQQAVLGVPVGTAAFKIYFKDVGVPEADKLILLIQTSVARQAEDFVATLGGFIH